MGAVRNGNSQMRDSIVFPPMARISCVAVCLAGAVVFGAWEPSKSVAKLPADGEWVRYKLEIEEEEEGVLSRSEFVVTISVVGTAIEKEQVCRWIEIEFVQLDSEGTAKRNHVNKLLIPEAEMLRNNNPTKQALRGWARVNDQISALAEFDSSLSVGESLSWLPGARAHFRDVRQPRDIQYQRGNLRAANAASGEREFTKADTPELGVVRWKSTFTIWHHADLSCGFAHAVVDAEKWLGDEREARVMFRYFLRDFGKDGKTKLPESN